VVGCCRGGLGDQPSLDAPGVDFWSDFSETSLASNGLSRVIRITEERVNGRTTATGFKLAVRTSRRHCRATATRAAEHVFPARADADPHRHRRTNIDLSFMRTSPILSFIAVLAIFYGWIYAIERNKESSLGVVLLLGFTLFMGLLLGPLLQRVLGMANGTQLVMMAAGGTAAVFFALSAVAATTKRDFSKLGSFLMVGVIVIMLAVVANLFLQSPVMHLVLLVGFVLLSSVMILYYVNSIVHGGETNYVSATLSLYVAVYNLFSSLLQLLGITSSND
jgi:modulator of FtsH protease